MYKGFLKSGVAVAIIGLAAAGAPAWAQADTRAQGPEANSDDIIVTANRREELLSDVAASITAIGDGELRARQITGFQELANQVPGFVVQSQSQGFNRLILRGQNSGSTSASVASVIDDIPFNFVTSKGSSGLLAANLDTWDLDRVEVLRGPQGTLYGAAAQGGLIKYVTSAPDLSNFDAAGEASIFSVKGGEEAGSLRAMINQPLVEGKVGLRVSGYYEGFAGFVENPLLGERNLNDGKKTGVRASLLVEPNDWLRARFTVYHQTLKSDGSGAVQVVGAAITPAVTPPNAFDPVAGYTQNQYNESIIDNKFTVVAANLEFDLGFATLTSITSYGKLKTYFTGDITVSNAAPGLSNGAAFRGVWGKDVSIRQQQTEGMRKFNQELRLSSDMGALEWQTGVFYSTEDTTFDQQYFAYDIPSRAPAGGPTIGGSIQPVDYEEIAGFGEATYHFTDRFDVSLGGRYSSSKQFSTSQLIAGILYPASTFTESRVEDKDFTFAASARWKVTDDTMIYARAASGFRPGGPLFAAPPAPTFYNSDRTVNYEVGIKTALWDNRLTAELTAYHIDWTDIQIITRFTASNNITYTTTGNAGRARSQGVEWNFGLKPVEGLRLGFLGAYTNARLTEDALRLGGRAGDKLAYVPDWSYTLNADYSTPAFADYDAFFGVSRTYIGRRFTDFTTAATTSNHVRLPSYNTVNLYAGFRNDRYSIQAYVKNVGNTFGITSYNNQGGFNQTGLANIVTPRTIGLVFGANY